MKRVATNKMTFFTISLAFLSEKIEAFCLWTISFSRGCRQCPGEPFVGVVSAPAFATGDALARGFGVDGAVAKSDPAMLERKDRTIVDEETRNDDEASQLRQWGIRKFRMIVCTMRGGRSFQTRTTRDQDSF